MSDVKVMFLSNAVLSNDSSSTSEVAIATSFQLQDSEQSPVLAVGQLLRITARGLIIENHQQATQPTPQSIRLYFTSPSSSKVLLAEIVRTPTESQESPEMFELSLIVSPTSMIDSTNATCSVSSLFNCGIGKPITGSNLTATLAQTVDCDVSTPQVDIYSQYDFSPDYDNASSIQVFQYLVERLGEPTS